MANKITGRAARHDDDANIRIPGETVQRLGERVAHLLVEIDALWAAQCNECDSVGHARGENVGGHGILLSCDHLFFNGAFHTAIPAQVLCFALRSRVCAGSRYPASSGHERPPAALQTMRPHAHAGPTLVHHAMSLMPPFRSRMHRRKEASACLGSPNNMPKSSDAILVHGAWADGSSWAKVIPLLAARDHSVAAVQLSLTSLGDDAARVKRAIALASGPIILAGYSYGGAVISEAGNDPKVEALVYIAAFAPDAGEFGGIARCERRACTARCGSPP